MILRDGFRISKLRSGEEGPGIKLVSAKSRRIDEHACVAFFLITKFGVPPPPLK